MSTTISASVVTPSASASPASRRLAAGRRDRHVHEEAATASGTRLAPAVEHEEQRERERVRDRGDHPRREVHHEAAELAADPARERVAEDATTTGRRRARRRPRRRRRARGESHAAWTTCAAALSASSPRRVSGADEIERHDDAVTATKVAAIMYAYEKLVCLPTPRPAGAPQRRSGTAPGSQSESRPLREPRRALRARGGQPGAPACEVAAADERDGGRPRERTRRSATPHASATARARRRAPTKSTKPGDAPAAYAGRRDDVVVAGGERARGERREHCANAAGTSQAQRPRRDVEPSCGRLPSARRRRAGEEPRDTLAGTATDHEAPRRTTELRRQSAFRLRRGSDPGRSRRRNALRREHEHEVDPVRGEEAVGRGVSPNFCANRAPATAAAAVTARSRARSRYRFPTALPRAFCGYPFADAGTLTSKQTRFHLDEPAGRCAAATSSGTSTKTARCWSPAPTASWALT